MDPDTAGSGTQGVLPAQAKRKSEAAAENEESNNKRPRVEQEAKASPLLEIAFELRKQVLMELLLNDKPLEALKNKTPANVAKYGECKKDIHPAILSTCKQLLEEGLPILHSNRTACYAHASNNYWVYWRDMHGRIEELPAAIQHRMPALTLTIDVRHPFCYEPGELQDCIRLFARDLRRNAAWQDLEICLKTGGSSCCDSEENDNAHGEDLFLRPLSYFRCLKRVKITGNTKSTTARSLAASMMSDVPTIDLEVLYDATEQFIHDTTYHEYAEYLGCDTRDDEDSYIQCSMLNFIGPLDLARSNGKVDDFKRAS